MVADRDDPCTRACCSMVRSILRLPLAKRAQAIDVLLHCFSSSESFLRQSRDPNTLTAAVT
jgi:hypothetical protein